MELGRIYTYHPGYHGGNPNSHRAFWGSAVARTSKLNGKLTQVSSGTSLLANCFNQGWCHALSLQDAYDAGERAFNEGLDRSANPYKIAPDYFHHNWDVGYDRLRHERISHFVMLHDDVSPDAGWIDTLYEDLENSGADLMAAVVPIKDHLGITSTAIDNPDNKLCIERRLSMAEVYTLPEVFSSADCGYPNNRLLANTGCWIVNLNLPFLRDKKPNGALKLRFNIEDEIFWDPVSRMWTAQVAPEDWNFSRDFQALGGKVMCTRRVKLDHWGHIPFGNRDGDWGVWSFDRAYATRFGNKAINDAKVSCEEEPQTVHYPPVGWCKRYPDVRGWLINDEGEALSKWAEGKSVLEIGSYCGLSTIYLSLTAEHVTAVDTFDGRGTPSPGSTLNEFRRNIAKHGRAERVSPLVLRSIELKDRSTYDMVFIDGAHDYESVMADIGVARRLLKPDGIIAFHDYGQKERDVTDAVDKLLGEGAVILDHVGSLLVVRPPALVKSKKKELVNA